MFCAPSKARRQVTVALDPFIAELEQLEGAAARPARQDSRPPAVGRYLPQCLRNLGGRTALQEATRNLAASLRWYQVFEAPENDDSLPPGLAEGLVAGQLAGKAGLIVSQRMTCGLFLLVPGLRYPLHTHGALELYFQLAGELHPAAPPRRQAICPAAGELVGYPQPPPPCPRNRAGTRTAFLCLGRRLVGPQLVVGGRRGWRLESRLLGARTRRPLAPKQTRGGHSRRTCRGG